MATAEAETSRDQQGPPGGLVYDGFISYSHAADDLLAPRLQTGLQRFAKPWWKRRALRIFRDESSLSANPHLWSSITDALDKSAWFVLLLSPEAAQSNWVNNEVEYWLEHRDPDRIIPVLTDGEFGWVDDNVIGDAVPPALEGAFSDEPRWVELRFARTDEQLDLSNPTFSAAVADIASPMRGVPKDELESEEVRQHRQTRRTAWAAGVGLVALTIALAGAGLFALDRANEAQQQREVAEDEARIAQEQRDRANTLAEEEQLARQQAQAAEQVASARALTASAVNALSDDPELSLMLALEAASAAEPNVETLKIMHAAVRDHRMLHRIPWEEGNRSGIVIATLSPDGRYLAAFAQGEHVKVYDLDGDTAAPAWSLEYPRSDGVNTAAFFTDDGEQLFVGVGWWPKGGEEIPPPEPGLLGWYFYDVETGALEHSVENPLECRFFFAAQFWSPYIDTDAPLHLQRVPFLDPQEGCSSTPEYFFVDPLDGHVVASRTTPNERYDFRDAQTVWTPVEGQLVVEDLATGDILDRFDLGEGTDHWGQPGGGFLVETGEGRTVIHDTAAGSRTPLAIDSGFGMWGGDGKSVVLFEDDTILVVALASASVTAELRGTGGTQIAAVPDAAGRYLASGAGDFVVRVWHLGTRSEVRAHDLSPGLHADSGLDVNGDTGVLLAYPDVHEPLFSWVSSHMEFHAVGEVVLFDIDTGEVLGRIEQVTGKVARFSPTGEQVAVQMTTAGGQLSSVGIFSVASGELLREMSGLCAWTLVPSELGELIPGGDLAADCVEGGLPFATDVTDLDWSPDGTLLAASGGVAKRFIVWDVASGEVVHASETFPQFPISSIQFSPDGEILVVANKTGTSVYDTATWEQIELIEHTGSPSWVMRFTPDGSSLVTAQAHTGDIRIYTTDDWQAEPTVLNGGEGQTRDLALSSDGTMVALSSNDGFIHIIDLGTGAILDVLTVGNEDATNVEFIHGDRHLLVTSLNGPVEILTLDVGELRAIGTDRITRGFTAEECATYHLDDSCPTLEQIRDQ